MFIMLACILAPLATAQQKPAIADSTVPAAPSPARKAGPEPFAQELERLDAELDRAALAGDKVAVAALLADGMFSVDDEGQITNREELLSSLEAPPVEMKMSIARSKTQVRRFGDTAFVISTKTRHWLSSGQPKSAEFYETNTYVMKNGNWKLAVSHASREPAPYVARDVAFDLAFDASQALGDKTAAIVLFEFGDYECPLCRSFAADSMQRIEKEYVRTGRVALVFRNNPLTIHPRAFEAAIAGECAASGGKFWAMNQRLLRDPVALSREDLARHAKEAGLDPADFERCSNDGTTAAGVRRQMEEAAAIGVRGTPVFLIGVRKADGTSVRAIRMIGGAYPYEVFQAAIDSVIRARNP